jgi:hypothetical protein
VLNVTTFRQGGQLPEFLTGLRLLDVRGLWQCRGFVKSHAQNIFNANFPAVFLRVPRTVLRIGSGQFAEGRFVLCDTRPHPEAAGVRRRRDSNQVRRIS